LAVQEGQNRQWISVKKFQNGQLKYAEKDDLAVNRIDNLCAGLYLFHNYLNEMGQSCKGDHGV
jgi:hypothetical protein